MPHLFTFDGKGTYSPDGKVKVSADVAKTINAQTDATEVAYWQTKPDQFAPAYYSFPERKGGGLYQREFYPNLRNATVKTWGGSVLGRITYAHVYPHNFGARMVSLMVRGNNGANYYGRASWDNGEVIRLRKSK